MKERVKMLGQVIRKEIRIYRSVMTDPRCPRLGRWMLAVAITYALSPIDLIPDFIPIVGHLDDIIILPILIWLAVRLIPKELIAKHRCLASEPLRH